MAYGVCTCVQAYLTLSHVLQVPNMIFDQRLLGNFLQNISGQIPRKISVEDNFEEATDE